jgi:hypothetical protein
VAESVVAHDPVVFALVSAAAELALEVVVLAAGAEVVSVVPEPEVFALVFGAADFSPVVVAAVALAAGPEVVFVVDLEAASVVAPDLEALARAFGAAQHPAEVVVSVPEPEVSAADVAAPQASVGTAVAFVVSVPVSAAVVAVYSPGRPRFLAFPNAGHCARFSSSFQVVDKESVRTPNGARTNYGLCNIPSNPGLHQNRNSEHGYSNPSRGCNNVSDTNDLPMDATTSHSRKICLHLYWEQRKHRSYRASL